MCTFVGTGHAGALTPTRPQPPRPLWEATMAINEVNVSAILAQPHARLGFICSRQRSIQPFWRFSLNIDPLCLENPHAGDDKTRRISPRACETHCTSLPDIGRPKEVAVEGIVAASIEEDLFYLRRWRPDVPSVHPAGLTHSASGSPVG
jgi:hypothetical protein